MTAVVQAWITFGSLLDEACVVNLRGFCSLGLQVCMAAASTANSEELLQLPTTPLAPARSGVVLVGTQWQDSVVKLHGKLEQKGCLNKASASTG